MYTILSHDGRVLYSGRFGMCREFLQLFLLEKQDELKIDSDILQHIMNNFVNYRWGKLPRRNNISTAFEEWFKALGDKPENVFEEIEALRTLKELGNAAEKLKVQGDV